MKHKVIKPESRVSKVRINTGVPWQSGEAEGAPEEEREEAPRNGEGGAAGRVKGMRLRAESQECRSLWRKEL